MGDAPAHQQESSFLRPLAPSFWWRCGSLDGDGVLFAIALFLWAHA